MTCENSKSGTVIEFKKFDTGKPRWTLLPYDALLGAVHIMEIGAARYGADNWANGADWSRYFNALQRHLIAWWMGEKHDPETGRSHLLHALCCLLFLAAYEIRGIGRDDRPQLSPEPEATASEPTVEPPTPVDAPSLAKPSYSPTQEEWRWTVQKVKAKAARDELTEQAEEMGLYK